MTRPIIRVENLGKQYTIGTRKSASYRTLRESLTETAGAPLRWLRGERSPSESSIWALKDVSFEVKPGDVVGIIGPNGAGKSTLLKVLSRITEPTMGQVDLYGRIGSLLEVGTGFHAELTGRENIYLNGAILGMQKRELDKRFDEIVDFAQIEAFLDTPVKRYSTGMYMRLAFAVAAHLETEILLVDEVLAVGDAEFQKKCLRKIHQVGSQGRTILLVSHNMAALRSICTSGLVIDRGKLVRQGPITEVLDHYLTMAAAGALAQEITETPSFIVHDVQIRSLSSPVIKTFAPLEIRVRITAKTRVLDPDIYFGLLTPERQRLAGLDFKDFESVEPLESGQQIVLGFVLESIPFLAGTYLLEVHLKDLAAHRFEVVPRVYEFEIAETPVYGGRFLDQWFGHVGLKVKPLKCQIEPLAAERIRANGSAL